MDPIEIAVPGLVVLVGAAGAGKSTLAARLFSPDEIVSSDAVRAAISGDAADQRATRTVFGIVHREVSRRLDAGRLVVVDATNVERGARLALIRLARAAGAPAIAIALLPPAPEVQRRNAGRPGRVVPAAIVERHLAAAGALGPEPAEIVAALRAEGFAAGHVLTTTADTADARVIRRVSPPGPARTPGP